MTPPSNKLRLPLQHLEGTTENDIMSNLIPLGPILWGAIMGGLLGVAFTIPEAYLGKLWGRIVAAVITAALLGGSLLICLALK